MSSAVHTKCDVQQFFRHAAPRLQDRVLSSLCSFVISICPRCAMKAASAVVRNMLHSKLWTTEARHHALRGATALDPSTASSAAANPEPWPNHLDRQDRKNKSTVRNSRTTVSGPAEHDTSGAGDIVAEKAAGAGLASAFPFNPNKAAEYDPDAALAPPEGASVKPADPIVGASTVSEERLGQGRERRTDHRPESTVGPLDASASIRRTGAHNQSRRPIAGESELAEGGPSRPDSARRLHSSRENHPLRPRTHPRAIVHARGSAAHGVFEGTKAIPDSPARRSSAKSESRHRLRALLDRPRRARLDDTAGTFVASR